MSAQAWSALGANDHIPPGVDIILDAWRAAAIRSTSIGRMRLDPLPPLPLSTIEEDLHIRVAREMASQALP